MAFSTTLFDTFCMEYQVLLGTEGRSVSMTDDLQYALELQRARLNRKGLRMESVITPRGHFPNGDLSKEWSDGMFRHYMDIRSCNWARRIFRGDRQVFGDAQDQMLYTTAADLIDGAEDIGKETYTCPNGGNVTTIGELEDGCPYCGTHFELRDLYPRVAGFYYVKEIGGTEQEVKKDVFRYMLPLIIVFGIVGLISSIMSGGEIPVLFILKIIFTTALSAGTGAVMGYMMWAGGKLAGIFYEAARAIPLLPGVLGSKRRYEEELKRTSPDFSFDYFSNKAATIAKMLIFSEDPSSLPISTNGHMDNPYGDVVDALFRGPVIIREFNRNGSYCSVRADVQFDLLYEKKHGFRNRRKFVPVVFSRDLTRPLDQNYSVRKVSCRNCGGSFDASRQDHCPYCGTEYDIRKEDWFVTGFGR